MSICITRVSRGDGVPFVTSVTHLIGIVIFLVAGMDVQAQNPPEESTDSLTVRRGHGVVIDENDYERIPLKPTFRSVRKDEGPTAYSLKRYAPFARSQGSRNTSVGWALSYSARTIAEAIIRDWEDRSYITEHAYSPSFVYNQLMMQDGMQDDSCIQGASVAKGLRLLQTVGTVKMTDFPVSCSHRPDRDDVRRAFEHRIFQFSRLFSLDESNKTAHIKKSIRERKPVVVVIKVPPSLYAADGESDWSGSVFEEDGADWQAMTIVAYDDKRNGGSFEVMNSWGPVWGSKGFIWLPYSAVEKYVGYAFDVHVARNNRLKRLEGSVAIELADSEILETMDDGTGHFRTRRPLPSGTKLRIRTRSAGPVFMYIISSDDSRSLNLLFPDPAKEESSFLSFERENIWESPLLELDEVAGTDYLSVVLSTKALNAEEMLESLDALPGHLPKRLDRHFAASRVDDQFIHQGTSGAIDFSYDATRQTTTLVSFVIDHSDPSESGSTDLRADSDALVETSHPSMGASPSGTYEVGAELEIAGRVRDIEPESDLFINGRLVKVSPSGRFNTNMIVTDRRGTVLFEFTDTSGKVRSIRRYLSTKE